VLDVETLRLMLAVVSLAVLALFYLGVYRPTHSPFSGWWTFSLLCAASSSLLFLGNESPAQVFTNPAANAVSAAGATGVWFARVFGSPLVPCGNDDHRCGCSPFPL
jgi:hypothetical protein